MIGFWIVVALMTAGVVVLFAVPLMRRTPTGPVSGEADLAVYRDQLTELDRDRARGLIEPDQAAALETEIGRRMLAAARSVKALPPHAAGPADWRLAILLATLLPVASLLIYLKIGHPELPAQPLAGRSIAPSADPMKVLAAADHLRATLKPTKEFLDKWVILGETYRQLGEAQESVAAFRIALSLAPNESTLTAALAEALVEADGGTVGEEAKQLFSNVPADSAARPEARFYLALADEQVGNEKAALAGWQSLVTDSPADAPWLETTRTRIARAATVLGLDPTKAMPRPRPAETQPESAGTGPDAAAVEAASKMTPEQQTQMIQAMVAKLAARLEGDPGDADGWRQLARAYQVLGDADKAKNALARADEAEQHKATGTPRDSSQPLKP